jgi:membrane-bound serine protease (ClpP class)
MLQRVSFVLLMAALASLLPLQGAADFAEKTSPEAPASQNAETAAENASDGDASDASEPTDPESATPAVSGPTPSGIAAALPAGANVAIIPIEGMIYDFVLDSLERRVKRALDNGASVIVLELDTYGGQVTSALEISKFLKDRNRVPVPTIAWVNNKAYSAGILIGAACDELVMANASATGDCAPIVPGMELAPTERAKAFSPIATEFKSSAAAHGYTYATFHAMCVLGVELYLIEHPDTGQRLVVNQADYRVMVQGDDSTMITPIEVEQPIATSTPPPPQTPEQPTSPIPGLPGTPTPPATTTPTPTVPTTVEQVRVEEASLDQVGQWRVVTTLPSGRNLPNGMVHDGTTLFTPDEVLAKDIGLSKATLSNDQDIQRYLGAASVTRINQTWSENAAAFLTQPVVRGVLVLALLLGAYMEFQSPGLGFPGIVAGLALVALIAAPMVVGLAEIWHILLFLIGFALLVVELMFTPTFGLLGIVGILMMLGGLIMSIVPSGGGAIPTVPPGVWDRLVASLVSTLVAFLLSLVGFVLLTRYFGSIPGLSRLILGTTEPAFSSAGARPAAPIAGDDVIGAGQIAIGQTGRVTTTGLRPAGRAEIAGRVVDVVSLGSFIEPGQKIRVVEVRGNTITVDVDHA